MPKASVKRLIECKKNDLINLVLDIEKYPEFVPFCFDAKIYENKNEGDLIKIIADLTIGKGPFKDTYKSDVVFNKKNDTIFVFTRFEWLKAFNPGSANPCLNPNVPQKL